MQTRMMETLRAGPEYEAAEACYSNSFRNGAGRQKPGSVGFVLWLLYDIHRKNHNDEAPTKEDAVALALAYGLNETSAMNALGKWCAYHGFRRPRAGAYAQGPSR